MGVEYSLTAGGKSLRPVILALRAWGQGYLADKKAGIQEQTAIVDYGPTTSNGVTKVRYTNLP